MSRSAVIASLAIHAGLVLLIGWRWSSFAARIGPGPTGPDASFVADAAGGSLVVALPALAEPVVAPQLVEPEFSERAPAVALPSPQIITTRPTLMPPPIAIGLTNELPSVDPKVPVPKKGKTARRTLAQSSESSPGQGGTDASGNRGGARGAGFVPPQFRIRYKPVYPEAARAQRLEGTVLLLVSIDADGRVTNTVLQHSCGHLVLDRAALAAVRSWRFDPARQNGVAVFARVEVPVRFRFEEHSTARS